MFKKNKNSRGGKMFFRKKILLYKSTIFAKRNWLSELIIWFNAYEERWNNIFIHMNNLSMYVQKRAPAKKSFF